MKTPLWVGAAILSLAAIASFAVFTLPRPTTTPQTSSTTNELASTPLQQTSSTQRAGNREPATASYHLELELSPERRAFQIPELGAYIEDHVAGLHRLSMYVSVTIHNDSANSVVIDPSIFSVKLHQLPLPILALGESDPNIISRDTSAMATEGLNPDRFLLIPSGSRRTFPVVIETGKEERLLSGAVVQAVIHPIRIGAISNRTLPIDEEYAQIFLRERIESAPTLLKVSDQSGQSEQ